jgi:PAS domain S-box-containing protein/diguanylate cyclase (GGDEF)-like protein
MLLNAHGGSPLATLDERGGTAEAGFERLASIAVRLVSAPVAVISLVDGDGPFAAGDCGECWRARREAVLSRSLCRLAAESGEPLLLRDAREHPEVLADPTLWLGEVGYAGFPIHRADGRVAGTLCVADSRPRVWTDEEVDLLRSLASLASHVVSRRAEAPGVREALAIAARSASKRGVNLRMLKKAVETMTLGVTVTDVHGRILYINPADARMHGYEADELVGKHARIFAPPAAARPLAPEKMATVEGWNRETVNVRKDGTIFPVMLRSDVVRDAAGRPLGLVTCCEDLTHRKHLERELLRSAYYDAVTGQPNRGLLTHRLELAVELARMGQGQFALLAVEIDRVQLVADSLGRAAAEELLRAAAERLRECVPPDGMIAHVGGDQFAVLLEDVRGVREPARIAACIRSTLTAPFRVGGREVFSGASIGIVLGNGTYERAEDVLRDSTIAMVRAREAGEGQYQVFDPAMHAEAIARLHLETDLRHALQRGELRVHYQPIVKLETGRIAGFEALARWEHPTRGMILPDEFVPLAEETGLILPMGLWVLEQACTMLRGLQDRPGGAGMRMAVNLSARQFTQPDLVDRVAEVVARTGIEPGTLELEITESTILQQSAAVMGMLHRLKALGVRLHVDDFGTGYSSLSYLHRLPLDALKIDRSFVTGAGDDPLQIVRTIVAMAQALGVEVVTEGIENPGVLSQIRALRCEYGQGYLFSRPASADAAQALLDSGLSW